tara:strand:+ start:73016 stop:73651 length:636 start_codon:yes stop_codon:yes gene_type:complete
LHILDYQILYVFILATTALAVSPGPDIIYVLLQSAVNGKKYGFITSLGLVSGCLVHTTLLAFGVSVLINENEIIYFCIKLFGAVYLLYLAFKVYKNSSEINIGTNHLPKKSLGKLFKQGFIMNVLNPKVTIFFLAFFPGFLFSNEINIVLQFYILGLIFMIISLIVFSIVSILSGMLSKRIREQKNIGLFLKWLQIVVFIGIAGYLLFSNK